MPQQLRRIVLTAGTAEYAHMSALPKVREDLADIASVFTELGYDCEVAEGLIDPQWPDHLRRALYSWARSSEDRSEDVLVVYYTGHGQRDDERHYLMCGASDPDGLAATALPTEEVVRILTKSGIRRLLLIIDTCHAGRGTADAIRRAALQLLAELKSAGCPSRDQLVAFSVIAAAMPREEADDGAFAAGLCTAVRDVRLAGQRQPYIYLKQLVDRINEEFADQGRLQRATWGTLRDEPGVDFIPNPRYREDLPLEGTDLAEQRFWISEQGRRRREEMDLHFAPRGRGTEGPAEGGHYFTGRLRVLSELATWLRGEHDSTVSAVVLTGSPGVGKSAVLGRLVLRSDPAYRGSMPSESVLRNADLSPNTIDVAVHARHKTLDDVIAALADAAGVRADNPAELMAALRGRRDPFVIVIDALDEAGTVGESRESTRIATRLLNPLTQVPCVRLLIGTRPHVVEALGRDMRVIDLDDDQWTDRSDLGAYATRLLLEPHGPGSSSIYGTPAAVKVASGIAHRSYPNFLVTRLTARALASSKRPLETTEPDWEQQLPTAVEDARSMSMDPVAPAFRWALLQQLGAEAPRVRRLVLPLALAEGAGLPWDGIWPTLASAVGGEPFDDADIAWVLEVAASHIVEALDETGRSVYRLYHQALADELLHDAPSDALHRITTALIGLVPTESDGRDLSWGQADPYLLTHLATHAADSCDLDQLITDPEFLVHAEPATLLPVLSVARGEQARLAAAVYRASLGQHHTADSGTRRKQLSLNALRFGATEFHARLSARTPHGGWKLRWATGSQTSPALRAVLSRRQGEAWAVACTELAGRPVAVIGGKKGEKGVVRIWNLRTGEPIGKQLVSEDEVVGAVTCAEVDDHVVAITGGNAGTVEVWDLATGELLKRASRGHDGAVAAVATATVRGRLVAVSAGNRSVMTWPLSSKDFVGRPLRGTSGQIFSLACTVLDDLPVAATGSGAAWLWDLATEQRDGRLVTGKGELLDIAFTELEGRPIAVTGATPSGMLQLWDVRNKQRIGRPLDTGDSVSCVACLHVEGPCLAVTGHQNGLVQVWDLGAHQQIGQPLRGHGQYIYDVACTILDGDPIAVSVADDGVRVWNLLPKEQIGNPVLGHRADVRSVACTTLADRPLAVSGADDGEARVWDVLSGEQLGNPLIGMDWAANQVTAVACGVLKGRPMVVAGGFMWMKLWSLSSRRKLGELWDGDRIDWAHALAWTVVEGRPVLVSGIGRTLMVWDIATRQHVGRAMKGHTGYPPIAAIACTDVGGVPVAVTGGADGTLRLWNLTAYRRWGNPMTGHTGPVNSVACTHLGGLPVAVTGGEDGSLRLWDLVDRAEVAAPLTGHTDPVRAVACAELDGLSLAASGSEGEVRLWDIGGRRLLDVLPMPAEVSALAFAANDDLVIGSGWEVLVLTTARQPQP